MSSDDPQQPRNATNPLFIGGGEEEPPAQPAKRSSSQRPVTGHPSDQRPPVGRRPTTVKRAIETGDPPTAMLRKDGASMVTIVAIGVAVLGLGALLLMGGGDRAPARTPRPAAPETVPEAPRPAPAITITPSRPKPVPPSQTSNLLANPSLEEVVDGKAVGWEPAYFQGTAVFTVADSGRRGRHSLCITASEPADVSWMAKLTVKPHTTYLFKGWIRTEQVAGAMGALFTRHPTDQRSEAVTGTSGWRLMSFQFDSGDNTTVEINCLLGGWGRSTGTAWFDDLELIELFSAAR
jgi:hypothetical protein